MNKNTSPARPILSVALLVACFGLATSLRAQLVTYNIATADSFDAPTVAATLNNGNVTASVLSATGVLRLNFDTLFNGHFLWANWEPTGTVNPADKYYSFTITPNAGFQIDFSTITYSMGAYQTLNWQLRSSIDAYSSNFGVHTDSTPVPGSLPNADAFTDDLSALSPQTGSVTFRIYGYNHTGNGDDFDGLANNNTQIGGTGGNLVINGTVSAVPEPHQYALIAGLGLLGFAAYRQRNRLLKA